jgi:hypothetical protein
MGAAAEQVGLDQGLAAHRGAADDVGPAEGDLDFRGTLGVARDAPVGFREIRLRFRLDTDADDEQIATLLKLTERYCVVYQTLRGAPTMTATIDRPGSPNVTAE